MVAPKQKTKVKFALFDFMSESNKESSDLNQILSKPIPEEIEKIEETKTNNETTAEVEIIEVINSNNPEENVINEQSKPNKLEVDDSINEINKDIINSNPEEDIISKDPAEKIDLFKAIFLSSSDESSSDETEEKTEEIIQPVTKPEPEIIRIRSPAKGLFANLDLEALAMPQPKNDEKVIEKTQPEEDLLLPEGSYGPVLPQKGVNLLPSSISSVIKSVNTEKSNDSITVISQWVEKKVKHKHKKEKKSKHKHKKNKKHKKSKD